MAISTLIGPIFPLTPTSKLKGLSLSQATGKSSGRVNRANQRKLASLYSAGDTSSDLAKYNQFKVSRKFMFGETHRIQYKVACMTKP